MCNHIQKTDTDLTQVTEKSCYGDVANEICVIAEKILDTYLCVPGFHDHEFVVADEIHFDAIGIITEDAIPDSDGMVQLIDAYKNKQQFQAALSSGNCEIVSVGSVYTNHFGEEHPIPLYDHLPVQPDQIYSLANCANIGAGSSCFVNCDCGEIFLWEFHNPIRLESEQDLIDCIDRILNKQNLDYIGFLTVKDAHGNIFTVYSSEFAGWAF